MSIQNVAKSVGHSLITWTWTKRLLHWLIMSAGTMSELAFLVASLWVSINANVHTFVLLFLPESMTVHLTQLATAAYVALPECIVGLAVVVTLSHIRVWLYNRRDYRALIWSVLYGVPTVVFLVLSLVTLGNAVASVTFEMPVQLVVIRALAGYLFAFTSLLYSQIGVVQERDRLTEKDTVFALFRKETDALIAKLQSDITGLQKIITEQTRETEKQKTLLAESKNAQAKLIEDVHKSNDTALQAYSEDCITWLKSGIKTVLVEEITRYTGYSKRKIGNAITSGELQVSSRNKELVLVSSLLEWLKNTPSMKTPLHIVTGQIIQSDEQEKLAIVLDILAGNPAITDEELAPLLTLKRPASARFWRLKALDVLAQQSERITEENEAVNG